MSRTFFSLRRRREFGSRHPAPSHHRRRSSGVVPLGYSISAGSSSISSDDADQFRRLIKPCGCTVSTMDLSEARGLVLFRVIRGSIEISQRLGAKHHVYRPLSYLPSNPSVSRTDWPPPEKITGDGRALHPRRSSGLRFQFFCVEAFSLLP